MSQRSAGVVMALLAVAAAGGCHHRAKEAAAAAPCQPAGPQSPAEIDLRQLQGNYAVTFVATEGARAGSNTRGRLTLRAQDQALVRIPSADTNVVVSQPFVGAMELAVDSIGATRMGNLGATDAATPGVGVYVTSRRGGPVSSVLARVGSGSNVRGQMVFDGGYFTLFVSRVGPDGIWGGWRSSPGTGGMVTADAQGHFCAEKLPS